MKGYYKGILLCVKGPVDKTIPTSESLNFNWTMVMSSVKRMKTFYSFTYFNFKTEKKEFSIL